MQQPPEEAPGDGRPTEPANRWAAWMAYALAMLALVVIVIYAFRSL